MKTTIKATTLYDGKNRYENRYIVIEDDKIIRVTDSEAKADYEGIVTPAFIDAHVHIGLDRQGEPDAESESNDFGSQIQPLLNPLNSIYFDDRAFAECVDFGVLYGCVVPGSGNILGGKAIIIKNFASNREEAFLKDYGYKMALGYNPRSTTDWSGVRPNTRMGVYAMLENRFDEVLRKKAKWELDYKLELADLEADKANSEHKKALLRQKYEAKLDFTAEDLALLELLEGKKTAKVHLHKEDDALYLIELVKKYGLKATADHTSDFTHTAVYDKLAAAGISVCFGPLGSFDYKVELKHCHYANTKYIMQSKVNYGLISDHPVTLSSNLKDGLKYFLYEGMNEAEAIGLISAKNAQILGIDDRLGSIEAGKTASLIVWDKSPFLLAAKPAAVFAEGKIVRNDLHNTEQK